MSVSPVPAVRLNGAPIATGRDNTGRWPAAPLALTGVNVKWGRSSVLEQPTPAMATARLFDPTGVWASSADLIGLPLAFEWTAAGTTRTCFTGRVGGVEVAPHVAVLDNVRTPGALVTLTGTSLLADLANLFPAETSWPAETVAARRTRLAALCAGTLTALTTRPVWDAAPLAAVDKPNAVPALEHLRALFTACGADRYTFDPHTRAVTYLTRRSYPDPAPTAYLVRDAARPGVYVRAPGGAIDGGRVGQITGATKTLASRLTHVKLTYSPGGTGTADVTVTLPGYSAATGMRTLAVTTSHTDATQATAAANDLAALVTGEGSGWALGDGMRLELGAAGFDSLEQARLLIGGAETSDVYFLAHSWLPDLGVRPLFGVMGGTIAYTERGWAVAWSNAPTSVTGPQPVLEWDNLDPSLVWEDDPTPASFDDSVTYADLGYVASGAVTTPTS